jgi:hypothetical protein
MINAILHGKKRGTGLAGLSFDLSETENTEDMLILGKADGAEDVLTATIFERISYLPNDVVKQVFSNLGCPEISGIDKIQFWPHWDRGEGFVEPDVHIQSGNVSLLVEAKRWDDVPLQCPEQLAKELSAGWQKANRLASQVTLLTVGGFEAYSEKTEDKIRKEIQAVDGSHDKVKQGCFKVRCVRWFDLYKALQEVVNEHENSVWLGRMCDDIAFTLRWHAIRISPPLWLKDWEPENIGSSIGDFDNWRFAK